MTKKSQDVSSYLHARFHDAHCELLFHNDFECLVAIVLSAQTTDAAVNKVSGNLFARYPSSLAMSKASLPDIEELIKSLGLYHNKAKNLLNLSQRLESEYHGLIPFDREKLIALPGVGRKTAGVFLVERAKQPFLPVDTHIARISKRLGYARKNENPLQIERILEKSFPSEERAFLHHALIAFGRNICTAVKPKCDECGLKDHCLWWKKTSKTTGR